MEYKAFETYSAFPEHVASISDNGNPVCARKGTHLSDSQPTPPWLVQSCDLHGGGGLNLVPASSHPGLECTGQAQAHTASSGTSEDGSLLVLQSAGPSGAVISPRNSGSTGEGEVRCPVTISFLPGHHFISFSHFWVPTSIFQTEMSPKNFNRLRH